MRTFHVLDADNIITQFEGHCGGSTAADADLTGDLRKLVGTPLSHHVSDQVTLSYLKAIFFSVRQMRRPLRLTYRCDTPDQPRAFHVDIEPKANWSLHLYHTAVALLRPVEPDIGLIPGQTYAGPRCSVCCHQLVDGGWIDTFQQPGSRLEITGYTVCAGCKSEAVRALARAEQAPAATRR